MNKSVDSNTVFQIFGRPITGLTGQAKVRYIGGSQFDIEKGESLALKPEENRTQDVRILGRI